MRFQRELMRERRLRMGLSFRKLERAMGSNGSMLSAQALQQWEKGDTTPRRLEDVAALAAVLQLDLKELFVAAESTLPQQALPL